MTTIEKILDISTAQLEAMSDDALKELLAPLIPTTRKVIALSPQKESTVKSLIDQIQKMLAAQNAGLK